jgi:hypothetical protein
LHAGEKARLTPRAGAQACAVAIGAERMALHRAASMCNGDVVPGAHACVVQPRREIVSVVSQNPIYAGARPARACGQRRSGRKPSASRSRRPLGGRGKQPDGRPFKFFQVSLRRRQ